jgi:O-antigen/teichoic acid export membrane protein
MDTILLSFLRPSTEVGIYNVAYKIMENLIFFPAMLVGLIMPLLAKTIFQNRPRFEEIADKTAKVFFILALPIVLGTLFLAPQIVALVSGTGFEGASVVLQLLIFSLAFIFFGHYFNMLLIVGNAQRKMIKILLIVAFFNIISNLILIEMIGYIGAAVVSALTELLVISLLGWLTYRTLHYRPHFEKLPHILLSGIMMILPLYFWRETSFLLAGGVGVLIYGVALWGTKAVSSNEILSLMSSKEEIVDPTSA